ncbi:MAG: HNH endonuclease, partial [Clostridia bacterium]|nr:HNH endonuclease [Clostridia bacterium]
FLYGDKTYSDEINNSLISLQKLNQTTIFLFLFRVFDDYENNVLSQAELEKVLGFLLNYSIRRLICEIGSNSLRGLYKTLYSRVFARSENKQHYYDSIVSFFQQLTSKDALPDDDSFILALKQNNLYRKNALCKYLLVSIENEGKEQLVTTNLTIEHVLPQTKNLSTAWQQMLGENWQADRDRYLHTLGNLTLTGYNSELGDKPFAEKKELLSEVHTKVVKLYETIKCCDEWNAATIEARAEVLSKEVAELYSVEPPQVIVDFSDPRYKEYSCTNPDDATYKTPNYYILQGERVSVNNYAEMLRSVVSRLYAIDSTIIENMARHDEQLVSWSQNVMFSYDSTKTTGDYQIKGTSIYESVGFSAYHIMCIIHALLIKYDIEATEFVYSARSNRSVDESTSGGSNE